MKMLYNSIVMTKVDKSLYNSYYAIRGNTYVAI